MDSLDKCFIYSYTNKMSHPYLYSKTGEKSYTTQLKGTEMSYS